MVMVSRNVFARMELHKRRVNVASTCGCKWCGSNTQTKAGKPYLYEFENQSDGGRTYAVSGAFCSVSCMKSYHSL